MQQDLLSSFRLSFLIVRICLTLSQWTLKIFTPILVTLRVKGYMSTCLCYLQSLELINSLDLILYYLNERQPIPLQFIRNCLDIISLLLHSYDLKNMLFFYFTVERRVTEVLGLFMEIHLMMTTSLPSNSILFSNNVHFVISPHDKILLDILYLQLFSFPLLSWREIRPEIVSICKSSFFASLWSFRFRHSKSGFGSLHHLPFHLWEQLDECRFQSESLWSCYPSFSSNQINGWLPVIKNHLHLKSEWRSSIVFFLFRPKYRILNQVL